MSAALSVLLITPVALAEEWLCEFEREDWPGSYRINIDDEQRALTVVNAKDDKSYPITLVELTPQRVAWAFNSMVFDPSAFVRDGKVVSLSLTLNSSAMLERSAKTIILVGYVTDDEGQVLSLEQLEAMQAEEDAWQAKGKKSPSHIPAFWMLFRVGTFRSEGTCQLVAPRSGD